MPLKKSVGNMYDWVTDMHTHLAGECPHKCKYCYVQKYPFNLSPRYKGGPRLIKSELDINYGNKRTIFIEHCSDLFADGISYDWILSILNHCKKYPHNTYVFQTKNPARAFEIIDQKLFPQNYMIGTTIETDRIIDNFGNAPRPSSRVIGMLNIIESGFKKIFITIEPIMDFDVDVLADWLIKMKPEFVNIGADSKRCNLPEPSKEKILEFIDILRKNEINIKKKFNLGRLLK